MRKLTQSNPEKYKNRLVVNISMKFYHHDEPDNWFRKADIYLTTDVEVADIDKNGVMHGNKPGWGAALAWRADDFKVTKFSFKLMQVIANQVAHRVYTNATILGCPLASVVNTLKRKKVDFGNTLAPLAGL